MNQTELDDAGIEAAERQVQACKEKDELAGGIPATQHALAEAEALVKRLREEKKSQFLDNSKPHGVNPESNTAPGTEPKDIDGGVHLKPGAKK